MEPHCSALFSKCWCQRIKIFSLCVSSGRGCSPPAWKNTADRTPLQPFWERQGKNPNFPAGNASASLALKTFPSASPPCSQHRSSSSPITTPAPPRAVTSQPLRCCGARPLPRPFAPIISVAKARSWWSWTRWICHCRFGKEMSGNHRVGVQRRLCSELEGGWLRGWPAGATSPAQAPLGMQPEPCSALGALC